MTMSIEDFLHQLSDEDLLAVFLGFNIAFQEEAKWRTLRMQLEND